MADIGAKGPPAGVNSAMLASMADHGDHVSSKNLNTGAGVASHDAEVSHHPYMTQKVISEGLMQGASSNNLSNLLPAGKFELPGVVDGGVFGEQEISLGNQELAKVGHNLQHFIGNSDTALQHVGLVEQFNAGRALDPLDVGKKGSSQGH